MHPHIYHSPFKTRSPILNSYDYTGSPISPISQNIPFSPNRNILSHSPSLPPMVSPRRLQHINCILPKTEEEGGLFIGDTISTLKQDIIFTNEIQAVLCCNIQASCNLNSYSNSHRRPEFKFINIQDHQLYPICSHFEQAFEYIQQYRQAKKNVLIQCHGGVSRSGSILCSYLMRKNNWSFQQAYNFVTQKRPRVKPNAGFWKQLLQYQTTLLSLKNNNNLNDRSIQFKPNGQQKIQNQKMDSQIKTLQQKLDFLYQTPRKNNISNKNKSRQVKLTKLSLNNRQPLFSEENIVNQNTNPQKQKQVRPQQNFNQLAERLKQKYQILSKTDSNLKEMIETPIKIKNQPQNPNFNYQQTKINYSDPMNEIGNRNFRTNVIPHPHSYNIGIPVSPLYQNNSNTLNFSQSPHRINGPILNYNHPNIGNKFFHSLNFNTKN